MVYTSAGADIKRIILRALENPVSHSYRIPYYSFVVMCGSRSKRHLLVSEILFYRRKDFLFVNALCQQGTI